MCRTIFRITMAGLALTIVGNVHAQSKLADQISRLAPVYQTPDEQKAAARMVSDAIQTLRKELNDRSNAEWHAIKTRAEWEKFRQPKLDALRASLGQFPPPPKSLDMRVTGTIPGDGFVIENIVFQSRPGLWVTANLYRPTKPAASMPGILICHAHHTPKAHGELQDMGMTWARAGCLVLVMDQLGHGERRQHPFVDATSYAKPYKVSRQDYYFRYDNGIQLHLVGDSLIGWMAWDLMRGVDLLLAQKGIDRERIILLGSVAGGGDPAAVVGALDPRIACVAPFNYGAPSPRPQYPYPLDQPPTWNYVGGGSWESTRNLRNSGRDGFMPWMLVASAAPRRLVYAHEFGWFREGDPTWKRLQTIYGFYDAGDRLSFTFGKGDVSKKPPEATHCTHIGPVHRKMMHEAFGRWFQIDMSADKEYTNRLPTDKLRCMTPKAERDLKPRKLTELLGEVASERMDKARKTRDGKSAAEQRRLLRADWARVLGNVQPAEMVDGPEIMTKPLGDTSIHPILLNTEPGITVPLTLLWPARVKGKDTPVVVAVCQAGRAGLIRERAAEIAALLEGGVAVCLPDLGGTGETGLGSGRGYQSAATSLSSSELMLGETPVGNQLRDLRAVLAWLRTRKHVDTKKISLWGDSLAPVNAPDTNFAIPRDTDLRLPPASEPLGALLAMLAALYEDDIHAVYARGGLVGFHTVLDSHLVLMPHDVVIPGVLTTGDLSDVAAAIAPRPLLLEDLVDGVNRRVPIERARAIYKGAGNVALNETPSSPVRWLLKQLPW